jgi:hypothetical protein
MAEGYKDWTAGNVLTAADLEDYTVKQSVMRFASASARNTALASVLDEGMMAWLDDVNSMTVYSGSAWSTIGPVHGAWTSWTPTVTQSGSVTVTVSAAAYSRLGRLIIGSCILSVTGSGTGANDVILSLPVAAAGGLVVNGVIGGGFIYDVSATSKYRGLVVVGASASQARMLGMGSSADAYLGSNTFTAGLASGDTVSMSFQYEAAADA